MRCMSWTPLSASHAFPPLMPSLTCSLNLETSSVSRAAGGGAACKWPSCQPLLTRSQRDKFQKKNKKKGKERQGVEIQRREACWDALSWRHVFCEPCSHTLALILEIRGSQNQERNRSNTRGQCQWGAEVCRESTQPGFARGLRSGRDCWPSAMLDRNQPPSRHCSKSPLHSQPLPKFWTCCKLVVRTLWALALPKTNAKASRSKKWSLSKSATKIIGVFHSIQGRDEPGAKNFIILLMQWTMRSAAVPGWAQHGPAERTCWTTLPTHHSRCKLQTEIGQLPSGEAYLWWQVSFQERLARFDCIYWQNLWRHNLAPSRINVSRNSRSNVIWEVVCKAKKAWQMPLIVRGMIVQTLSAIVWALWAANAHGIVMMLSPWSQKCCCNNLSNIRWHRRPRLAG